MFMAIKDSFFRLEYVIEYRSEKRMNLVADFFRTEQKKLVSYVRSRIDDAADRDAEDIVQDVMLNMFDKADISIPIENLAAYIYQSLRNRIVDLFRKRKQVDSLEKVVQDSGHDPGRIFENKQLQDMVFEALGFLNADERDLLMATEFDDRSFRELSEEWGVPLGTLLARKSRALEKIRKKLTNMV
jgi:RNA polymerase sigma factor (sigma-70 family)